MGFEPMTSCLLNRRSNHLSYGASLGDGAGQTVKKFFVRLTKKTEECEADIARQ